MTGVRGTLSRLLKPYEHRALSTDVATMRKYPAGSEITYANGYGSLDSVTGTVSCHGPYPRSLWVARGPLWDLVRVELKKPPYRTVTVNRAEVRELSQAIASGSRDEVERRCRMASLPCPWDVKL